MSTRLCPLCSPLLVQLQDGAFLSSLTTDQLQDRMYELDALFRRDLSRLTERYDTAKAAAEAALASRG